MFVFVLFKRRKINKKRTSGVLPGCMAGINISIRPAGKFGWHLAVVLLISHFPTKGYVSGAANQKVYPEADYAVG
jgi:hypothetical protein